MTAGSKYPPHDYRNRKKSAVIGFHVTPEERELLRERVYLSGKTQQDYMLQSALCHKIVVVGNEHLRRRIIEELERLKPFLIRTEEGGKENEVIMKELRTIYEFTDKWE